MNPSGVADLVTHIEELKQQMQMQERSKRVTSARILAAGKVCEDHKE
jgi:hypothetical protein